MQNIKYIKALSWMLSCLLSFQTSTYVDLKRPIDHCKRGFLVLSIKGAYTYIQYEVKPPCTFCVSQASRHDTTTYTTEFIG